MSDAAILEPQVAETPTPSLAQFTELAELAGGFIHDIKNHLGTLSLNLQLLAEDFENPETPRERRALERVNRLHGECQKLTDLAIAWLQSKRLLGRTARFDVLAVSWPGTADAPVIEHYKNAFEAVGKFQMFS